jgi:hypothetical protein
MKLNKINHSIVSDRKEVPGLINCQIDYEIKAAQGKLDYQGPKFTPEMWHQVMTFFRWTFTEMQSECQVRLYVNLKLGRWGAWAFPQAARTGMTARELPVQEAPEQARDRFAFWQSEPSDDWLYFGTAHHHCSTSAFQSSTDEENERNQDGLHITVGKMDTDRHDLHARFYLNGNCFEPDLSAFWPLDRELAEQVPAAMHDALARFQMCGKVTVDFPEVWRSHLVETRGESRLHVEHGDLDEIQLPVKGRADRAWDDIARQFDLLRVEEDQWLSELQALAAGELGQVIVEACIKHGVTPEDLLRLARSSASDEMLGRHWW